VEPTLIPGSGGVFDVVVDGRRVFSKHEVGDFPDEAALIETIASG
jgi:selenoprotein W-related protein